jgi:hypothetical protein
MIRSVLLERNLMLETSFAAEKGKTFSICQIAAARRSWGPSWRSNVAEEARTRGFASQSFDWYAFIADELCALYGRRQFWDVLNVRNGSQAAILA